MSADGDRLSETRSLCPTCLADVPATYVARDGAVYLSRTCPDHGETVRQVWGSVDHWEWANSFGPDPVPDGDIEVDGDHACLAVVEVTEDCNLSCSFCFASSGPGGKQKSFEEVVDLLEVVKREGGTRPVQFSGGEPTVREDLPELVARAREMGFEHVQVNTNGLVLAGEPGYAQRLADAGATAIYLQFDGLEPATYEAIREVDISDAKHGAIEACREADLPVILVPTVVPGTNDHELGDIVRFALENDDVVQSVNLQPVAHFGRYEQHEGRFSADECARRLAAQLDGLETRDLLPVPCCSSTCQLATAVVEPATGDDVMPVTRFLEGEAAGQLSGLVDEADWLELLAGTSVGDDLARTAADCCGGAECCGGAAGLGEGSALDGALGGLLDAVMPVSVTGFMDADAADVGRLNNCCLSVPTPDGDLVPFCGYNMTTDDGAYALRNRHGWGGRDGTDADLPEAGEGASAAGTADTPPAPEADYPRADTDDD
jgi:uncharacterized radical SAM superfamily Fe-S cluster-containing enzyme